MNPSKLLPWSHRKGERGQRKEGNGDSDGVNALQTGVNRAFDVFFRDFGFPALSGWDLGQLNGRDLRVDVQEADKEVKVTAELPGMEEGNVDVSLAGGLLTLRGQAETERENEDDGYLIRERRVGVVERVVPLPDGLDLDAAQAKLQNGLLEVVIPKLPSAQKAGARQIPVRRG
jgi:HSP20 family protein